MKTYLIPNTEVVVFSASLMETQTGSSTHEANVNIGGNTSEQDGPIVPF